MNGRGWRGGTLALLLIGLPSCATAPEVRAPLPGRESAVVVAVTNENWADMSVYVVQGGSRFRLGAVTSMATERFRLPRHMVAGPSGGIQLMADAIGSATVYRTEPILVSRGQWIEFIIQNAINFSSYSVRNR